MARLRYRTPPSAATETPQPPAGSGYLVPRTAWIRSRLTRPGANAPAKLRRPLQRSSTACRLAPDRTYVEVAPRHAPGQMPFSPLRPRSPGARPARLALVAVSGPPWAASKTAAADSPGNRTATRAFDQQSRIERAVPPGARSSADLARTPPPAARQAGAHRAPACARPPGSARAAGRPSRGRAA